MSEQNASLVKHAEDMAAVADELLESHLATGSKAPLIGACLCINHIIDWVWAERWIFGAEERTATKYRTAIGAEHPQWRIIRDIATGLKHPLTAGPKLTTAPIEWEDDDWFLMAADRAPVWFVEVDGRKRAVAGLCTNFLSTFRKLGI